MQGTSHLLPCSKCAVQGCPARGDQYSAEPSKSRLQSSCWIHGCYQSILSSATCSEPSSLSARETARAGEKALQGQGGAPSPPELLGSPSGLRCLGFLPVIRNSFCTCRVTKVNRFCLRWFTLLRVQFQSGIFRAYHMPFRNVSGPAQRLGERGRLQPSSA